MSIDFSKITGLRDQRGKVVQIADQSGKVLWSANVPKPHEHKKGEPVLVRKPTCTVPAQYAIYCADCGVELDRYEDDGVFAEHIADGGRVTTAPTCVATGIRKYYCRECSTWIKDETIPATGIHTYKDVVTPPTCTTGGHTTHTCTVCGHSYTDNEKDPNGHNFVAGWVVTKAVTCTTPGTARRTCLTCDHYEERTLAAPGHSYTSKVTAPTCTAEGYTTHTCTVCGHSYIDIETAALGYSRGNPIRVREAICTVPAQYAIYCTRCSVELDRYEDDGVFAEHIADGGRITKYATCTEKGVYTYRCRECDTWLRDEVIDALGHDYEYDHTVDATCEDGGYDVYTCTRCGDWYTDNDTEPNGHDFSRGWVTDVEPNCTESGAEYRVCGNCAEIETRSVDALGHDWEYYPDPTVSSGQSRQCRRCELIEEDV